MSEVQEQSSSQEGSLVLLRASSWEEKREVISIRDRSLKTSRTLFLKVRSVISSSILNLEVNVLAWIAWAFEPDTKLAARTVNNVGMSTFLVVDIKNKIATLARLDDLSDKSFAVVSNAVNGHFRSTKTVACTFARSVNSKEGFVVDFGKVLVINVDTHDKWSAFT